MQAWERARCPPKAGFIKGDLLGYYRQIAPVLLPHLKDRPVTLRVYPQGVEGASYYLRGCPEQAPDWLQRVQYQPKTVSHPVPLPLIDTTAGLLWFANLGAIEFHLWGSHTPVLARPDLAIFDLDPGETASFAAVREAALRLHDALEQAGVSGYPKTSGEAGCTSLCRSCPVTPSSASAPGSKAWGSGSRRATPPWSPSHTVRRTREAA